MFLSLNRPVLKPSDHQATVTPGRQISDITQKAWGFVLIKKMEIKIFFKNYKFKTFSVAKGQNTSPYLRI